MKSYKIALLGDASVGKTMLTNRIIYGNTPQQTNPTIGVNMNTKNVFYKGVDYELHFWDTAGEERYKSMAPIYIHGSSLVFIVFDVTNEASFDHISNWITMMNGYNNVPVFIIGNKCDLDNHIKQYDEFVECIEQNYSKEYYFEVSALSGLGIMEIVDEAIRVINENEENKSKNLTKSEVVLTEISTTKKCC